MSLKTRLGKLEQPLAERWRAAWELYVDGLVRHTEGLIPDPGKPQPELEALGLTDAELDARVLTLVTSWGVPHAELYAWTERHPLPDESAPPDLKRWPEGIADPPEEPPGVWEALQPYRKSADPIERCAAQVALFLLAAGRAHREYGQKSSP